MSQVHSETKRVLTILSKIGPSCNPSLLTGIDHNIIAKDVEKYARFINEHSSHYTDLFEDTAGKLCNDINNDIVALSVAKSPDEIKEIGTKIYYKINTFLPTAKNLADEKKENI